MKDSCVQVFKCQCMNYDECKQAWLQRTSQWNLSGTPNFTPYEGNSLWAEVKGTSNVDCPYCAQKNTICTWGIMSTGRCSDQ
jgi:hypothetical protein